MLLKMKEPGAMAGLVGVVFEGESGGLNGPRQIAGYGDYTLGKRRDIVEKRQRREMVGAAGIVSPAATGPDQNPCVRAGRGLRDMHVELFVMQDDFARDGDATLIGAKVEAAGG